MGITEHRALKLSWQEVCKIVSEEMEKILDIHVVCRAIVSEEEFWAIGFNDYRLPLPKLCQLLQATQASLEDWEDALPDEGGTTVRDIGMILAQKLIRQHLRISWEYSVAIEDGLWLIGVTDIDNTKSKQEDK